MTTPEMRVSDHERRAAGDRLKLALEEGRLDFAEYDRRLGLAYGSTTYADLQRLFADLPTSPPAPVAVRPVVAPPAAVPERQQDGLSLTFAGLPIALKILWTLWGTAMAINLTVWTLVGVGEAGIPYFWPVWLLVPGVALAGVTVAVNAVRAGRLTRHGPRRR